MRLLVHKQNRLFDLLLSGLLIILSAPVMVAVALLIASIDGFPVLFVQPRSGYLGGVFRLVKFRTMRESFVKINDYHRITKLGAWLRKTGLDELPQLFLVLSGKMSIVGPRPLLPEYLNLYSDRQAQRFLVKPGITGYAQIFTEPDASWECRLEADVWYVENRTVLLDLKLTLYTAKYIFRSIFFKKSYKRESFEKFLGNSPGQNNIAKNP